MAFAVVAFAAMGLGSYKVYGSYNVHRSLLSENVEAMSNHENGRCEVVECKTKPHKGAVWPGSMGQGMRHICQNNYASTKKDAQKYELSCSYYSYPSYSSQSYTQYCVCWNCEHSHKTGCDLPGVN